MGKSYKRARQSAERKNKELNTIVLKDEEAIFGRIIKDLGFGRFRIQVPDSKGYASEADAAVVGKSTIRVNIGDIVVVGRNESGKRVTYEILGSCDKAAIKLLRDAKRLHSCLFNEEDAVGDDFFDRSDDVPKEEGEDESGKPKVEKGNKPAKSSKAALATTKEAEDEEDDLNVDEI